MRFAVRCIALGAALIWLGEGAAVAGAARGGDAALAGPAFSAPATALIALAKRVAVAGDPEVVELLEEADYRLDRHGRETLRVRRIFKVRTPAATRVWDSISARWAPWYQRRPKMRARVILADGTVHTLDPSTITVSAAASNDHSYSDSRSMRAPLPAVQVGSIVEEEIVYRDAHPYFGAGINDRFWLATSVPIHDERLTIDAPRSLPVRPLVRLGGSVHLRRTRSRRGGRVIWRFEARSVAPWKKPEAGLPSGRPRYPYVAFSTGRSWRAIARAYADIVDRRIAAGARAGAAGALPAVAGKRRDAILRAAVAKVRKVRYTGLEFGQRAIVPWTPRETWKRQYGDCKDKATLLVALLRRAGIRADVAVLRAGFGQDVERALPGLSDFDHAIVYVPGRRPLWIDPTAELAPLGQLPISDQGRLALVAARTTRRLIRIPTAPAAANRDVEVRDIVLPDKGLSHIAEHTTLTGFYALDYRRDYRDIDADRVRKHMGRYVKSEYQASKLVAFTHDDPEKLAPSFHLTVTAGGCRIAYSDRNAAYVVIRRSNLLDGLPYELRGARHTPRRSPLAVTPYRREIDYRIEVPPGFSPRPLPPDFVLKLGPLALRGRFEARPHLILATLRFDVPRRTLTAAEVNAVRAAIRKLRSGRAIEIVFDQVGMAALDAGDIGKAVGEFRRLARLQPHQALHHRRLAEAYLKVGLGTEARAEARRALALSRRPGVYGTLGWVLQHDDLGRNHYPGANRRGAIRAYRKALARDPTKKWIRGNLAILLAYGAGGDPYGGDLAAAITQFRRLHDHGHADYDINLMRAYLRAGRFKDLLDFARTLDASRVHSAYRLVAAAALGGARERQREFARLPGSAADHRKALEIAAGVLVLSRHYQLAADALRAAAARDPSRAAKLRAHADFVASLRPHEHVRARRNDPRAVARAFLSALAAQPRNPRAAVAPLLSRLARAAGTDAGAAKLSHSFERGYERKLKKLARAIPGAVLADMVAGAMTLTVKAAAPWGWRVEARPSRALAAMQGMQTTNLGVIPIYVVKEGGRMRILSTAFDVTPLAAEALALARRGKLAGARKWLDWATPTFADAKVQQAPFLMLWRKGHKSSRRDIERAAASLLDGRLARRGIPILRRCARESGKVATACAEALITLGASRHRAKEAYAALMRLRKRGANDPFLRLYAPALMAQLGHLADAQAEAKKALAAHPNDLLARHLLATIEVSRGDIAAGLNDLRRITSSADAADNDFNDLAWYSLLAGRSGDDVLAAANRAVAMNGGDDASEFNTLACVHAARGEYVAAYQAMLNSMRLRSVLHRAPQDWLVTGRIAAGLGLRARALAAYAKAAAAPDAGSPASVASLAAIWKRQLLSAPPGAAAQGATTVAVPLWAREPRNCADWRSATGTSNSTKWPSEPLACWY